jgi:hypothetical protein
MVAGRSSKSSRRSAAKLYGTQRMTHSGIGAMGSAKGRIDDKDSSRRERLIGFERKLENVSARNYRVRWRSALILAGGRSMLRHLRLERNGKPEDGAQLERYDQRRSWKGCTAMRQGAENAVRVLLWLPCRLVLVAARIGSGPMADDK